MRKKKEEFLPVPETWGEFFNQLARELPSTLLMTLGCIILMSILAYAWKVLGV